MAPEYVAQDIGADETALFKCDVYSFGVTLLETLSGRQNSASRPSLVSTVSLEYSLSYKNVTIDSVPVKVVHV
jgi:hypothetical protein